VAVGCGAQEANSSEATMSNPVIAQTKDLPFLIASSWG
jgi:hypothetical protein